MLSWLLIAAAGTASLGVCLVASDMGTAKPPSQPSVYDFSVKDIGGEEVQLSKYKGDVLMIVNVASK